MPQSSSARRWLPLLLGIAFAFAVEAIWRVAVRPTAGVREIIEPAQSGVVVIALAFALRKAGASFGASASGAMVAVLARSTVLLVLGAAESGWAWLSAVVLEGTGVAIAIASLLAFVTIGPRVGEDRR